MKTNLTIDKRPTICMIEQENLQGNNCGQPHQSFVNFLKDKTILLLLVGIFFSLIVNAQVSKSLTVTPGSLSSVLTATELSTVTNLTLTGSIDARDFKTMRDKMPLLKVLDIGSVNIADYYGDEGTNQWWLLDYPANTIPDYAFMVPENGKGCAFTSVTLPSTMTSFGYNSFKGCSFLESITIPPLVTNMGYEAFSSCIRLKSVIIPESVTNTGNGTFSSCRALTSINIPSSVTTIDEYCFSYCSGLTSISIPSSVTTIRNFAFIYCKSLIKIELPPSVISLGEQVFEECSALTSINFPPLVSKIGNYSFRYCTSLKSFIIPPTVTSIGSDVFVGCTGLTSITIPSSVVSLGDEVFEGCTALTSIDIGSSLTKIGEYTFRNCSKLNSFTVGCSVPPSITSGYVFYNVDRNSCTLNVPYGTSSLYAAGNQWKDFKNIVEPNNGFYLSSHAITLPSEAGSTATIDITANVDWTISSDQNWLEINPSNGTGSHTITLTAELNRAVTIRTARVTISSPNLDPQTITVSQYGSNVAVNLNPGSLAAVLTSEELNTLSTLILTGSIDARDFKTMRDNMPLLAVLDLRGVNIVAYNGTGGTTILGNINYLANTIPEFAFYNGVIGKTRLNSIVLPESLTSIAQCAFGFCSGLTSISVNWPIPIDLSSSSNVFQGWSKNYCTLNVPYGTASRYAVANQWKDFTHVSENSQGFNLSSYSANMAYAEGSALSIDLFANVEWTVNSDQDWLAISPAFGNSNQLLTLTAKANTLERNRTAIVTISGKGATTRTIIVTQNVQPQPIKTLELTAGSLSSVLAQEVLNTISKLVLTGTIDARDFKTMRDKMPLLAVLDLSGANIVAYKGSEGTSLWGGTNYLANTIPESAFYIHSPWTDNYFGKTSLTSVILPNSLTSLENYAFAECNGIINMVIPQSVTAISNYAFYACKGLTSVSIPSSIISIGSWAFNNCQALTSISIPSSVTSIESSAFRECNSLTSINIPSSVKSIGSYAFIYCLKLTSITVNWLVPLNLSSSSNVFGGIDKNVCTLTVPYGTTSLYASANQWKDFTHIVEMPGFHLLENTVNIGFQAGSSSSVTVNSDITWTAISDQTWLSVSTTSGTGTGQELSFTAEANPKFTTRSAKITVSAPGIESQIVTITQSPTPKQIEVIAGGLSSTLTAEELQTITNLTITGTIDARDFKIMRDKMPSLAKLDLSGAIIVAYNGLEGTLNYGRPYSANAIPEDAFYKKNSLLFIQLPSSITSIERDAFSQCIGLTDIVIPSLVKTIDANAFYSCKGLKTITLPSSIVSLGTQCFRECINLTSISVNCSIPPDLIMYYDVFYLIDKKLCILNVPYGTASKYHNAYQWNDFWNVVESTNGFSIGSNNEKVAGSTGSKAAVYITSNIEWTLSSDQNWLTIDPISGSGNKMVLFTANENPSFISTRTALVTVSTSIAGVASQKITITQSAQPQPPKTFEVTPGGLAATLTNDELATLTDLTLTGTIDARDFKTMRDRMPLLSKVNISNATIVAYHGTEGTSKNGNIDYPDNTVPEYAFVYTVNGMQGKSSLKSIVLPESLITIGPYSFSSCIGLNNVIISKSLTTIGTYAFYGCQSIYEIIIPSAVSKIGIQAFGKLYGSLFVDPDNPYYMINSKVLFNKAQTELIQCSISKSGSYTIPSTVTSIGSYAFSECTNLTTVTIPTSVTFIGESAFALCRGLTSLYAKAISPVNLDLSPNVFNQINYYNCTLYVPRGSKVAYQAANLWKNFQYMLEINPDLIANAGQDKTIDEGKLAMLDGTASVNTSGNPLTYQWTAPAGITLSSTTAVNPTFTAPEVTSDTNYTFSLTVSDGSFTSIADQVVITVKQVNKAPVANAGTDQSVNENSLVTLDGSASSDPDNDELSYLWTAPSGITLSSVTTAKPTFTAPEVAIDTNYTFSLTVSDGSLSSTTDQIVITVKQVNKAPVANAGTDQSVNENSVVTLDGSATSDPDNDHLSYLWTAPAGITLSSETALNPTFTAPEVTSDTNYTFSLTISDGSINSISDQVLITVKQVNKAPIANAGTDQAFNENSLVILDGSASTDLDNNQLSYVWTAPAEIILSSNTAPNPTFTAPQVTSDTDYTFSLTVGDGSLNSIADQVVITVKQVNKTPIANAGTDQSVNESSFVTLDGSASMDPDNDQLSYVWTAPEGITLSSGTTSNPTFTAPSVSHDTQFTFTLMVSDGKVISDISHVTITVQQSLPILKLISKTTSSTIPVNEVIYQLYLKQGGTFIEQSVPFQLNGDTIQFAVTPGEWIVLASPLQNSKVFVSTYLGNTLNWIDAEHLTIFENSNIFKEITCMVPQVVTNGSGQISGFIYETTDTGTKSISITASPVISDNPIPNVLVRLFKKDNTTPVLSVWTDSQGAYQFDHLEMADYEIDVELPGYTQSEKFGITLSSEAPSTSVYFAVNTTLQLITDTQSLLFSLLKVYPNPVVKYVIVDMGRTIDSPYQILVYNMQGELLLEQEAHTAKTVLDLSKLLTGNYLMNVCIGKEKHSTVIIKK